jgi:hypothetical protein
MPTVYNKTSLAAELVPLIDPQGHNVAVVIAKATYAFASARELVWADPQAPLLMADSYLDEPALSLLRVPSDLYDSKPATDVIIVAPAEPLDESPLKDRKVSLELGPVHVSARIEKAWPFGPVPRDRPPRAGFAGTYDANWARNRMPLLPEDFDPRFHQAAPKNQTAPGFLQGDETLKIKGLYEGELGEIETTLPGHTVLVAGNVLGYYFAKLARLDTVLIWSAPPQLSLVWRYVIRPRQKIEDVRNVYLDYVRLRAALELYGTP